MANNPLKRCPTLVTREMPIKTTMRYYFTPMEMAKIKKVDNNKCWWTCGETGTLIYCWGNDIMVQSLCKTIWPLLRMLPLSLSWVGVPGCGLLEAISLTHFLWIDKAGPSTSSWERLPRRSVIWDMIWKGYILFYTWLVGC